jgi:hypothetical protein
MSHSSATDQQDGLNAGICDLLAEELSGRDIWNILPNSDEAACANRLEEVNAKGHAETGIQIEAHEVSGSLNNVPRARHVE